MMSKVKYTQEICLEEISTEDTILKITVAGVGYVGLSLAVLLAQHHEITAITTTEKNQRN